MISIGPAGYIIGMGRFPIDRDSEGFKLITRIQDEAHRFAIEYHRLLRSKGQVHSHIDDIPGNRTGQKEGIDEAFQGIEEIKAATVEELAALPTMNGKVAQQVYDFFHKTSNDIG